MEQCVNGWDNWGSGLAPGDSASFLILSYMLFHSSRVFGQAHICAVTMGMAHGTALPISSGITPSGLCLSLACSYAYFFSMGNCRAICKTLFDGVNAVKEILAYAMDKSDEEVEDSHYLGEDCSGDRVAGDIGRTSEGSL